jgi:hypothetical protein
MAIKRSKAIGFGFAVLIAALWSIPLERAISYFSWAREYFAESSSMDALNDVCFSRSLLVSYVISSVCSLALCLFFFRRGCLLFLLPFALVSFTVIELIGLQPEEPITLVQFISPWLPAYLSLTAFAFGALIYYLPNLMRCAHRFYFVKRIQDWTSWADIK